LNKAEATLFLGEPINSRQEKNTMMTNYIVDELALILLNEDDWEKYD